ncbi:MAG: hypothetical protein MZW92_53275 [Comamonadaceae bacterium]|nr:hypothetical protein [Comamonadaceae bacterium]
MAAIALVFSLLSPAMGWLAHAGNAPVRQLSLTHVFLNSVDLFTTNQVVLLSPRRTVRRLSPTLPAAYLVQDRREDSGAGGVYEFADSGVPTAAFDAPLWMTRLVSVAGFPAQGPFMALRGEDAITLVNRSSFLLHECSWIRRGIATRIADLPAGQERVLDSGALEATTAPSVSAACPPSCPGSSPNTRTNRAPAPSASASCARRDHPPRP